MGGVGRVPVMQGKSIEVELLEMEQEADKAALKERSCSRRSRA